MSDPHSPTRALNIAYSILARRDNSEFELRAKLGKKGIPAAVIAEVLEQLKASGYLDDRKYLLAKTRNLLFTRFWGERKIEAALRLKGFTREEIQEALAQARGEGNAESVLPLLIAREREKMPSWDLKSRQRLARRLIGRGFPPEEIWKALADESPESGESL